MPRINKTQHAILGCLSIQSMSAYDIKNFMARSTGHFWNEYEAQLYPTLKQLVLNKLVVVREEKAQKKGIRKVYTITDLGYESLKTWLMQPAGKSSYRNEFLLKLFFGDAIDSDVSLRRLEAYEGELVAQLEVYNNLYTQMQHFSNPKRKPFVVSALLYGIMLNEAEIAWCQKAHKIIANQ